MLHRGSFLLPGGFEHRLGPAPADAAAVEGGEQEPPRDVADSGAAREEARRVADQARHRFPLVDVNYPSTSRS